MSEQKLSRATTIRHNHHQRFLNVRAFDRILESEEWYEAFESASDAEINKFTAILESNRVHELRAWIVDNLPKVFENMSYRQLREKCKTEHVYRWSRLGRDEMVEALKRAGELQRCGEASE